MFERMTLNKCESKLHWEITLVVAKFIVNNMTPLNIVNKAGFKVLVNILNKQSSNASPHAHNLARLQYQSCTEDEQRVVNNTEFYHIPGYT